MAAERPFGPEPMMVAVVMGERIWDPMISGIDGLGLIRCTTKEIRAKMWFPDEAPTTGI
jgi:hypothetical protein